MQPRDLYAEMNTSNQPSYRDLYAEMNLGKNNIPKEDIVTALQNAPQRIGSDLLNAGYGFVKNIPSYYRAAKTEIPALYNTLGQDPIQGGNPLKQISHAYRLYSMLNQAAAGGNEAVNELAQAPLNIARYGSERLHLLPESVPEFMEKILPEDTTQAIKQLFGEPRYPGEKLARGAIRNIPNLIGGMKAAEAISPAITNTGLAKDIVKTKNKVLDKYSRGFNNLFDEADKQGISSVKEPLGDVKYLVEEAPNRYIASLKNFMSDQTPRNAHKSQSDLGQYIRQLQKEEAEKAPTWTSEQKKKLDIAQSIQKQLINNLDESFTKSGKLDLFDKYQKLRQGYKENAVPYKNASEISEYEHNKLRASNLISKLLNNDEFMLAKGHKHIGLGIQNALRNKFVQMGLSGAAAGAGFGGTTYEMMQGRNTQP